MTAPAFRLPRFYPIVNVADAGDAAIERAYRTAAHLAGCGVALMQLRAKPLGGGAMTALAKRLVEAFGAGGVALIVNDRADVAAASGAAGVHVGDEDLPVDAARRVLSAAGSASIVGYSTHSVAEAIAASSFDADYLGFGPVFDSPTKAGVRDARGLELLAEVCRMATLPVVAIGGITLETAPLCWKAGAESVAVISDLERVGDLRARVAEWQRSAREFSPE
ncbi:MAG TPA: thiamine phosphate synthase [Candidatus Limnocylindrales bacterium]|nr:thiamine phosphate synthase [Candidatus Limnocylindrales bacterium]